MVKHKRGQILNLVAVSVTLVAAWVIIASLMQTRTQAGDDGPSPAFLKIENAARFGERGIRIGPREADVTVVVFEDLTCGTCRIVDSLLGIARARHPHRLATVFRYFPLSEIGYRAALVARCGQEGQELVLRAGLYRNQDSIGAVRWNLLALQSGVTDSLNLAECMDRPESHAALWRDILAGDSLFIRATPTLLINDQLLVGSIPSREWILRYLDSLLEVVP